MRGNINCFKFRENGHYVKSCTHEGSKCYNCKEFGHVSPKYPRKKIKIKIVEQTKGNISRKENKHIR